jgi:hypothetical protein
MRPTRHHVGPCRSYVALCTWARCGQASTRRDRRCVDGPAGVVTARSNPVGGLPRLPPAATGGPAAVSTQGVSSESGVGDSARRPPTAVHWERTFASSCCCASWDTAAWASRHVPIRPGPVDIAGDALPATSTVFDLGLVWWWCRRTPGIARGRPSGTARSRPRRHGASPRVGRGPSFDRDCQGQFAVAISTAVEGRVQSGECVPTASFGETPGAGFGDSRR